MCNGLNHYRYCKCGFGNDGFLSFDSSYTSSKVKNLAENFFNTSAGKLTVPNFLCKCGKRVFFFQDANGGKVLFESLGPPWEKHFCLGWEYQKRTLQYNIDKVKWNQLGHFVVTPSVVEGVSNVKGIIQSFSVAIYLEVPAHDLLIIRDIYLPNELYKKLGRGLEGLVIYEDGNYGFVQLMVLEMEPFTMKEIDIKRFSPSSKNMDLFD